MPTAFEEITRNPIYLATESLITLFNKCRSTLGFFDEIALLVLTKLDMDFLIDTDIFILRRPIWGWRLKAY